MPQMKPMNWIYLFLLLNMIILMINILTFFMKNLNIIKLKKNAMQHKTKWLW